MFPRICDILIDSIKMGKNQTQNGKLKIIFIRFVDVNKGFKILKINDSCSMLHYAAMNYRPRICEIFIDGSNIGDD